jgi:DNA-binding GntR family transcriptional regulator
VNELMNGSAMSKARQAFVELREQILDGRLPPGSRLTLRPIAKSLGVNVGAVSEAVRELVHEQLVDFEPNYGARVKKLDLETMRSQHVLRIAIECEAIRRCTDRLNARSLEEVDRLVDVEERLSEARQADLQFHLKIAELSGVPSLVSVLRSCHLVHLLAIESTPSLQAAQIANRTHVELVDAIRSRDPDVAESAMREHCERSLFLQLQMTFGAVAR